jgi:transcriptional regulator with XRE-family HTH domain
MNYGARIRACRQHRKMTQAQIAAALGVTRQHVSHIEKTSIPRLTLNQWFVLADTLQVNLRDLLPTSNLSA